MHIAVNISLVAAQLHQSEWPGVIPFFKNTWKCTFQRGIWSVQLPQQFLCSYSRKPERTPLCAPLTRKHRLQRWVVPSRACNPWKLMHAQALLSWCHLFAYHLQQPEWLVILVRRKQHWHHVILAKWATLDLGLWIPKGLAAVSGVGLQPHWAR